MDNPYKPPDWLNNYSLHVEKDKEDKRFCPDKCVMFREININLRVYVDAQHDGRLLTEEELAANHYNFSGAILSKIATEVDKFIAETDPFAIHRGHNGRVNSKPSRLSLLEGSMTFLLLSLLFSEIAK